MKKIIPLVALAALTACDNPLETPVRFNANVEVNDNIAVAPDGTITAAKGSKITFTFDGEPDFISFGYDVFNATTSNLSFNSKLGNWSDDPDNSLQLYISTSFAGLSETDAAADAVLIQNHEWLNISSICEFPTIRNTDANSSISLDEYRGDSITLAFRYKTIDNSGFQSMWTIANLQIDNKVIKTGLSAINVAARTMGFTPFDMMKVNNGDPYEKNTTAGGIWDISKLIDLQNPIMVIRQTPANRDLNEDWLVSKRIAIPKGKEEKGEMVSVKNTTDRVTFYSHTFVEEGEYTVTFRASNYNYKANSSIEQIMKIIVE